MTIVILFDEYTPIELTLVFVWTIGAFLWGYYHYKQTHNSNITNKESEKK